MTHLRSKQSGFQMFTKLRSTALSTQRCVWQWMHIQLIMNLAFNLRPVNKKEQRNYKDFSRHAQNIQAVPRENENKWEFGWSTKEFSSFKCYFLSFVIRFGLFVLFLHQKQRIIYLNLRALSKSKSWSARPPVLTNGKRPLSMARPRPLLSKVKSVESGIHPWGMAYWPLN